MRSLNCVAHSIVMLATLQRVYYSFIAPQGCFRFSLPLAPLGCTYKREET